MEIRAEKKHGTRDHTGVIAEEKPAQRCYAGSENNDPTSGGGALAPAVLDSRRGRKLPNHHIPPRSRDDRPGLKRTLATNVIGRWQWCPADRLIDFLSKSHPKEIFLGRNALVQGARNQWSNTARRLDSSNPAIPAETDHFQ